MTGTRPPGLTRRKFNAGAIGTIAAAGASGSASGAETKAGDAVELVGLVQPQRTIPVPQSVSPQAQAFLSQAGKRIAAMNASGGKRTLQGDADAALKLLRPRAEGFKGTFETIDLPHGAKLYRAIPEGREGRRSEVAYFDIHGGGFVAGGGEMCRILAMLRALDYGVAIYSVDYRLAPEHQFPAALDDTVAAYDSVLDRVSADDLVVAGSSAGGNLAAALMLHAQDNNRPLPAGLVLMTPGLDMTGAGDTRETNKYLDVNHYGGASGGPSAYGGDADPTNPLLSPIFGTIGENWPRTFLSSGTRDFLLSDTVRMHRMIRKAGIEADLYVTEAGPHGGFMATAPEDWDLMAEARRFCDACWAISG